MLQTPQVCTQCGTRIEPGLRLCSSCGAIAPQQVAPTVAAAFPQSNPPYSASSSSPNNLPYPVSSSGPEQTTFPNPPYAGSPGVARTEFANPPSSPSSPSYPGYNSASTPVPPPPPTATPANPYSSIPYYPPSTPAKKRSLPLPIIIVVLLVVIGGGTAGIYSLTKGTNSNRQGLSNGNSNSSNGSSSNGNSSNVAPSRPLNLTVTYSGDQITFTEIKQASKFPDDQETTYSFNENKNWVRLTFSEKQDPSGNSYFSYRSAFNLILPDKSIVKATNAQQYSGPDQGVQRQNWADFGTNSAVDLSKLTMRLGASDEAQMDFPLKDGTDLSQYQPKQTKLSTQFLYAGMNWTLNAVTKSLYYTGKQAKTGQVFLAFDLSADNNQSSSVLLLSDSFRLKAGSSVLAPEYSSTLDQFGYIREYTSGLKGVAVFLVTPTPDGKYSLDFQPGRHIEEKTVDVQVS
ncbi:MAG TPA: hypothetical protein VHV10_17430 [Ktedonobacteraceae bacterium]|nr:hypothetical protein [Ktedonobacteraceae bacterium]